ncbi:uncharacterized protein A4U43_C07F8920 [Asparagus officinalis]|uniref:RNase H type-1 domain-containing protein n=1 Tax=Asparagus officinalis TaxID=4686 RepID=A0A5P1EAT0_ASPOF|nr:uncharacterized protein A4U43_C07F8920 [Asparagus officinalis]
MLGQAPKVPKDASFSNLHHLLTCKVLRFSKSNTIAAEVVVCEALAARDALAFALDIEVSKVALEMDNSVVINAIKYSDRELSELMGICAGIKRLG